MTEHYELWLAVNTYYPATVAKLVLSYLHITVIDYYGSTPYSPDGTYLHLGRVGEKIAVISYSLGRPMGKCIIWHETRRTDKRKVQEQGDFCRIRVGNWAWYYSSGVPIELVPYDTDGKRHGWWNYLYDYKEWQLGDRRYVHCGAYYEHGKIVSPIQFITPDRQKGVRYLPFGCKKQLSNSLSFEGPADPLVFMLKSPANLVIYQRCKIKIEWPLLYYNKR